MPPQASSPPLFVGLDLNKQRYKADDRHKLTFTLTNESKETMNVLKWHTPLEGFKSDMFRVEINGELATYLGPIYKRRPPKDDDYITLKPGETVTVTVDLTEAYDIARPGNYNVTYKMKHLHAGVEQPRTLTAQSTHRHWWPRPGNAAKGCPASDIRPTSTATRAPLRCSRWPLTRA